jgi:hypothetical protein
MPTDKNNSRAGTPNLCPAFPARILKKNKMDTPNNTSSTFMSIYESLIVKKKKMLA